MRICFIQHMYSGTRRAISQALISMTTTPNLPTGPLTPSTVSPTPQQPRLRDPEFPSSPARFRAVEDLGIKVTLPSSELSSEYLAWDHFALPLLPLQDEQVDVLKGPWSGLRRSLEVHMRRRRYHDHDQT